MLFLRDGLGFVDAWLPGSIGALASKGLDLTWMGGLVPVGPPLKRFMSCQGTLCRVRKLESLGPQLDIRDRAF